MATKQSIPTDAQIAAWRAGGYIVERVSLKAERGVCRANSIIYASLSDACAAAARLDRPNSMTFVNYAVAA